MIDNKSLIEAIDMALGECDKVIFERPAPLSSMVRIKLFKSYCELPRAFYVDIPINMQSLGLRRDNSDLCVAEEVKIGIQVLHKSVCQERIRLFQEAREAKSCLAP